MNKDSWLAALRQHRAIAVLRSPDLETGRAMAKAVVAGGFRLIEITWTSQHPIRLVDQLRQILPPECLVGVGTVLSLEAMIEAIAAGAQFCFSPHTDPKLIDLGQSYEIPVVPGALTPTEIVQAWQAGASGVKVFPCKAVGGADYIRHLQSPLSHVPMIPTGGITVETGRSYIEAGAIAVGISSNLFPKTLVARKDWQAVEERSRRFLQVLS